MKLPLMVLFFNKNTGLMCVSQVRPQAKIPILWIVHLSENELSMKGFHQETHLEISYDKFFDRELSNFDTDSLR